MTVSFAVMRWAGEQEPKGSDDVGPAIAKFVLMALANYARSDGRAWPTVEKVAAYTCASERAVRYALEALEQEGLIEDTGDRKGNTRRSRVWQLDPGNPARRAGLNVATGAGNVATGASNPATGAGLSKDDPVSEPIREPGAAMESRSGKPRTDQLPNQDRERVVALLVTEGTPEAKARAAFDAVLRRGGAGPGDFDELVAMVRAELR